ncbi:hypothetical protein Q5752_003731 [Cryptotrichosporon argae]
MPARPPAQPLPSSSSSALAHAHALPRAPLAPLFAQLTFFVVPPKIPDLDRVYGAIEELGGKCVAVEDAWIVVTALQGRPRLARAVGDGIDGKVVVSVEFVDEAHKRAIEALATGAIPHLPSREPYLVRLGKRARSSTPVDERAPRRRTSEGSRGQQDSGLFLADVEAYDAGVRLAEIPRLAVERPSPLVCVNQDIIDAIKPIYLGREYEDGEQKNTNVLSYRRSMSILKSVPRRIRSGKEAMKLVDVGDKVAQRIDEYLSTGAIAEADEIRRSDRYRTLELFASIFTIGPHTAVDLYDTYGCRDLDDVRAHYARTTEVREKDRERRRREGGMLKVEIVEEWLVLREELAEKIPRGEVQEIADTVTEHLDALVPGCDYTICGGYRRGKPESNDVDIVFRTPEYDQDVGLLRLLTRRLSAMGIVTHVLHTTTRDVNAPIHASANNFDNLDKAFVILRLSGPGRTHRRVDLIMAPRERYAAAILSWSGSMMFERDLRRYAEDRGYRFRAGLVVRQTGEEVNFETEREIFQHLGLRYVPPELRNADG